MRRSVHCGRRLWLMIQFVHAYIFLTVTEWNGTANGLSLIYGAGFLTGFSPQGLPGDNYCCLNVLCPSQEVECESAVSWLRF